MWFLIVAAVAVLGVLHARVGVSVFATVAHVAALVVWVGACGVVGAVLGGLDAGGTDNPFPGLMFVLQVAGLVVSGVGVWVRRRGRMIRYGR